jgi:hypothetical protein
MLRILARMLRRQGGRLLALMYLACVIGPPLAWATADGAVAAHCLTADHHAAAAVHVHSDGTAHSHDHSGPRRGPADSDSKDLPGNCCGLFCLNAATDQGGIAIIGTTVRGQVLQPALQAPLGGIGPFRIDRPPNLLASL